MSGLGRLLANPREAFVEQREQQCHDHDEVERAYKSRSLLHDQMGPQYAADQHARARHQPAASHTEPYPRNNEQAATLATFITLA
jgi:hypothetical protein